jgi:hypothetical protein
MGKLSWMVGAIQLGLVIVAKRIDTICIGSIEIGIQRVDYGQNFLFDTAVLIAEPLGGQNIYG